MSCQPARLFSRMLKHLALLAMLLLVCGPQASASWECEGRICGASAWTCCCAASVVTGSDCGSCQDLELPYHAPAAALQKVGTACLNDCHCTVVVRAGGQFLAKRAPSVAPSLAPDAVVPAAASASAPRFSCICNPLESRGPPAFSREFVSPSLRAPPAA